MTTAASDPQCESAPPLSSATHGVVDVVIVAHNAGDLLGDAVRSAAEQAGASHVWVMDAESTDGSVGRLAAGYPDVHVAAVPNAGFAASNNRGIECGTSEWVLLLNPDAGLMPDALTMMLAAGLSDPRVGVVGPLVINADGTAQANSYGRFPTLARMLALRVWRTAQRARGNRVLSPRVPARAVSVDWVTGAAMLVRRAAIEDVGPMDEKFFLYYEDIDWCHRMWDHSWKVVLEPEARVVHHLGKSGAPSGRVAAAYRQSLDHYCDVYGLKGLKAAGHLNAAPRKPEEPS